MRFQTLAAAPANLLQDWHFYFQTTPTGTVTPWFGGLTWTMNADRSSTIRDSNGNILTRVNESVDPEAVAKAFAELAAGWKTQYGWSPGNLPTETYTAIPFPAPLTTPGNAAPGLVYPNQSNYSDTGTSTVGYSAIQDDLPVAAMLGAAAIAGGAYFLLFRKKKRGR